LVVAGSANPKVPKDVATAERVWRQAGIENYTLDIAVDECMACGGPDPLRYSVVVTNGEKTSETEAGRTCTVTRQEGLAAGNRLRPGVDDGIRTRDPHLGKAIQPVLGHPGASCTVRFRRSGRWTGCTWTKQDGSGRTECHPKCHPHEFNLTEEPHDLFVVPPDTP
jgi:hypothetical protein